MLLLVQEQDERRSSNSVVLLQEKKRGTGNPVTLLKEGVTKSEACGTTAVGIDDAEVPWRYYRWERRCRIPVMLLQEGAAAEGGEAAVPSVVNVFS